MRKRLSLHTGLPWIQATRLRTIVRALALFEQLRVLERGTYLQSHAGQPQLHSGTLVRSGRSSSACICACEHARESPESAQAPVLELMILPRSSGFVFAMRVEWTALMIPETPFDAAPTVSWKSHWTCATKALRLTCRPKDVEQKGTTREKPGAAKCPIEATREKLCAHLGVSENRGPQNSTLNSRILSIRTPNKVPLIFGNSHLCQESSRLN